MNVRRRRRALGVALIAAALCASSVTTAEAATAKAKRRVITYGVDAGSCNPAAIAAHAKAHHAKVSIISDGFDSASWDALSKPDSALVCWANRPAGTRIAYALPMLPTDGTATVAEGATGAYAAYWKAFATEMVNGAPNHPGSGQPDAILRIGWEFNGFWQPWTMGGTAQSQAQWVAYWRSIVTALRSVPGQRFTIVWNPGAGHVTYDARKAYPGDAYVDVIGLSDYDDSYLSTTYPFPRRASAKVRTTRQQEAFSYRLNGDFGLNMWAKYASKHRKRIALTEFGLIKTSDAGGHGGGDDPTYIQGIFDWAVHLGGQHRLAFIVYFDQKGAYTSTLNSGSFTKASATFTKETKAHT